MAANLEWFWIVRGYTAEGRSRLGAALEAAGADSPSRARAAAAAGQMALQLGESAAAKSLLLEALSLAVPDQEPRVTVLALSHLGWAAEALGDPDDAAARHQRAVAVARGASDDWALGLALNNYGVLLARTGDLDGARPILEESLHLGRRTGEPQVIALAVNNLAEIAVNVGELDAGRQTEHRGAHTRTTSRLPVDDRQRAPHQDRNTPPARRPRERQYSAQRSDRPDYGFPPSGRRAITPVDSGNHGSDARSGTPGCQALGSSG